MLKGLSPGAVGVSFSSLEASVEGARRFGFDSVEVNIGNIADRVESEGPDGILATFGDIVPAGWGLPTNWRAGEDAFQEDLPKLGRLAKAAAAIGCTRVSTWVLPGSNELPLDEHRALLQRRFSEIAKILGDHGCSLGLEFIGPKTLRDQFKYPFLYRSGEMLDLAHEAGDNVGLLLDAWHWYTSGGTVADILAMQAKDVVYVHVNDAPVGIPVDEQLDNVRCLPGETGVIPIADFMAALRKINYEGSIVPEPFKKELADLPSDDDRLKVVSDSLTKIFA